MFLFLYKINNWLFGGYVLFLRVFYLQKFVAYKLSS